MKVLLGGSVVGLPPVMVTYWEWTREPSEDLLGQGGGGGEIWCFRLDGQEP